MGVFPSGQRGQTVNLLRFASVVRIHPLPPTLEHILITGMFHTFFELVIHEMPLPDAENYVKEMRAFYTAGWMKIMGQ